MVSLVGYTGFVGSNIYEGSKGKIENLYNSKNIEEAFGTEPDILIYAGLRAEKFLANNNPEKDMEQIKLAQNNISKIKPKKLVLISTIDVFRNPIGVDENSEIDTEGLHAYGYNRYTLEQCVRDEFYDSLIVRLPGLFGKNLKKNFIYDYINIIPFMLDSDKFLELTMHDAGIRKYYHLQDNGFYKLDVKDEERELLKNKFRDIGFSALNFTDSRSVYQFYNLARLWDDIQIALENDIRLWHAATEPVSVTEIYESLTGKKFENVLGGTPAYYDYKTIHYDIFNGNHGYICDKETVMTQIKEFVQNEIGY